MTARKPEARESAPDRDDAEDAVAEVQPSKRGGGHARPSEPPPGECDPFVAFTEWAGPIDEDDYADL